MQKSHTFLLAEIMFMQIDRNARTNDWTKKKNLPMDFMLFIECANCEWKCCC